jgi:ribosomal-protein-alanine N-acetyltransferase
MTERSLPSRRVILRPLSSGDQDEFVALAAASTDLHRPWMSLPATPREFQAYLTRYERPTEEALLICVRDQDGGRPRSASPTWASQHELTAS